MSKERPKYVRLTDGKGIDTAMRLQGHTTYWRDAGCWEVESKWDGDKLVVDPLCATAKAVTHLTGCWFEPISETEWAEDNEGYVRKNAAGVWIFDRNGTRR